jgi:hypothetical protein
LFGTYISFSFDTLFVGVALFFEGSFILIFFFLCLEPEIICYNAHTHILTEEGTFVKRFILDHKVHGNRSVDFSFLFFLSLSIV